LQLKQYNAVIRLIRIANLVILKVTTPFVEIVLQERLSIPLPQLVNFVLTAPPVVPLAMRSVLPKINASPVLPTTLVMPMAHQTDVLNVLMVNGSQQIVQLVLLAKIALQVVPLAMRSVLTKMIASPVLPTTLVMPISNQPDVLHVLMVHSSQQIVQLVLLVQIALQVVPLAMRSVLPKINVLPVRLDILKLPVPQELTDVRNVQLVPMLLKVLLHAQLAPPVVSPTPSSPLVLNVLKVAKLALVLDLKTVLIVTLRMVGPPLQTLRLVLPYAPLVPELLLVLLPSSLLPSSLSSSREFPFLLKEKNPKVFGLGKESYSF